MILMKCYFLSTRNTLYNNKNQMEIIQHFIYIFHVIINDMNYFKKFYLYFLKGYLQKSSLQVVNIKNFLSHIELMKQNEIEFFKKISSSKDIMKNFQNVINEYMMLYLIKPHDDFIIQQIPLLYQSKSMKYIKIIYDLCYHMRGSGGKGMTDSMWGAVETFRKDSSKA